MSKKIAFEGKGKNIDIALENGLSYLDNTEKAYIISILAENKLIQLPPPLFVHPWTYVKNNQQDCLEQSSVLYCIPNGKCFIFFN